MAKFQKTTPRKDESVKHPVTANDLEFLKELQTELNTQDTMGNRDPRFWVIRQTEEIPTGEEYADIIHLQSDYGDIRTLDDLKAYFKYNEIKAEFSEDPIGKTRLMVERQDDTGYTIGFESIKDVIDCLHDWMNMFGLYPPDTVRLKRTSETVPNTLFLTHRECENHLREYGYNYADDAHAYAMTAVRSPQFEKLIELLQTIDFDAIASAMGITMSKPEPTDPAPNKPWHYETGIEEPEILGSGSNHYNVVHTTSFDEAMTAAKHGGRNYLKRWKFVNGKIIREYYDTDTGKFTRS